MPNFHLPPYRVESVSLALSETIDWGLELLRVPPLWKQSRGQGVKVAVLDTGWDVEHPDLVGAVAAAEDFTGSRRGARDGNGHGTHVAGVIAARRNHTGVVGVAPECRLLVAKVLADDGGGSEGWIVRGIDWALEQGADVLSMSFGSRQPNRAIYEAIERAVAAGKFVLCAAGNDGEAGTATLGGRQSRGWIRPRRLPVYIAAARSRAATRVNYPARWPQTVAVGAVDREGRAARFSSRGAEVDIAAPGEDVLSTWLGAGYARLSGTSMATPFVGGVVALMLAKHRARGGKTPIANQRDLLEHLRRTAADAGSPGRDVSYGYGLIDPESMLRAEDAIDADEPPARPALDCHIGPVFVNGVRGTFVFVPDILAS